MRAFLCTGCTVCRGCMDAEERRLAGYHLAAHCVAQPHGQVIAPCKTCISYIHVGHAEERRPPGYLIFFGSMQFALRCIEGAIFYLGDSFCLAATTIVFV